MVMLKKWCLMEEHGHVTEVAKMDREWSIY